jgi:hypothetical protein
MESHKQGRGIRSLAPIEKLLIISPMIGSQLLKCLEYDTKVAGITFETIVDYLVLVVYLLKKFQVPFTELRRMILDFQSVLETLRKQLPISIYSQIIHTDTRNKLSLLKEFIRG